jgi:hypothetical protein
MAQVRTTVTADSQGDQPQQQHRCYAETDTKRRERGRDGGNRCGQPELEGVRKRR